MKPKKLLENETVENIKRMIRMDKNMNINTVIKL